VGVSRENVEIVRRAVDAFDRGDIDEALADCAPDVEWHTSGLFADERVYRGRAGIKRLWTEFQTDLEQLSFSISEIRAIGEDRVLVAVMAAGRGTQSKAPFDEVFWYVATVQDGLVARVEAYADGGRALDAVGLST
jgi:ketosteroid isomerase-like protein